MARTRKSDSRPSAPTRAKRVPRAIREQQMLDAAIHVFAKHGYRQASMDTIARAAETSKPMLYLYYGSKEELFGACVTRESERLMKALEEQIAPDDSPRERLQKVISAFLAYVEATSDSWNVVYRQAEAEPQFRAQVESTRRLFVDLTADLLERSTPQKWERTDTQIIATALVGAGEAVADRIAGAAISRDKATELLLQLSWSGLAGTHV